MNQKEVDILESDSQGQLELINPFPGLRPFTFEESHLFFGREGQSDEVLVKVLFGEAKPEGKLPFELPSSQEAVENQKEDVPYDSKDPLYPFGHGLRY